MWIICIAHLELSPSNRNVSCNLANVRVSAWPTFCLSPFRSFVAIYGALCALYIIVLCCDNERTNKITKKKNSHVHRTPGACEHVMCCLVSSRSRAYDGPILSMYVYSIATKGSADYPVSKSNDSQYILDHEQQWRTFNFQGGSWNQHQCFRFHRKMFSEIRQVLSGLVQARIKAPRRLVYCKRLSGPAPSTAKHTTEFDSLHKPNDLQWTGRRFIATFRHWRVYFIIIIFLFDVACIQLYSLLRRDDSSGMLHTANTYTYIHRQTDSTADRESRSYADISQTTPSITSVLESFSYDWTKQKKKKTTKITNRPTGNYRS